MGHSMKRASIESARDRIISRFLGLDSDPVPVASIARQHGVSYRHMWGILKEWKADGVLAEREPLSDDMGLIKQLVAEGMPTREIARKWGHSHREVLSALKESNDA